MRTPLAVLILEDSEEDMLLMLREITRGGYEPTARRVDTPEDMGRAMDERPWDIILADYTMPRFSAPAGLALMKARGLDVPFLIVAGSIGEDLAAGLMRAGAHDYISKNQLARLLPAVERELREFRERRHRRETEEALDSAMSRLKTVVSNAPIILFALDPAGVITLSEGRGLDALNLRSADVVGRSVFDLYPDRPDILNPIRQALAGETLTASATLDGVAFETRYTPLTGADGRPNGVIGVATDITERVKAEEALQESEKKFRGLFHSATDAIFVFELDAAGAPRPLVDVNDIACRRLACGRDELLRLSPLDLVSKEDAQVFLNNMRVLLSWGDITFELTLTARNGARLPVEMSAHAFDVNNTKTIWAIARDISERKQAEETIRRQAYHDALTGLPNRMLFKERLNQSILQARRADHRLGLLFLDLDRFKNVNETLGHIVGDQLLQAVAERLAGSLKPDHILARLGGDEFTILLPRLARVEEAVKIAQKLLGALKAPVSLGGHELHVNASVGIALFPSDGEDAEMLLRNADTALYRAKEKGRNTYQLYAPLMNATAFERLVMENSLRHALRRNEFTVHFQPLLDIASGRVSGMEALLRWKHPELGLVYPEEFIPIAEETGLIVPIGEWALRTACAQNKAWQDKGYAPLVMSVNLSARQVQRDDVGETVARALRETDLDPRYLELEITESVAMQNDERTIGVLKSLRDKGVQIAMDDFGTGYSSLSYLKKLPLHTLKIDQSFVRDLTTDPNDAAIATTVIALGHNLNLTVTAEGVENREQLEFLRRQHCDKAQGYLLAQPLAAEEFEEILKHEKEHPETSLVP